MEADTGATAADVVAAMRSIGIAVTAEDVATNWDAYRELARLFNVGIGAGQHDDAAS